MNKINKRKNYNMRHVLFFTRNKKKCITEKHTLLILLVS